MILAGCLSFHDLQEALQALQHKDNLLTDFVRMFIHDALVHSVRDMSYQNFFCVSRTAQAEAIHMQLRKMDVLERSSIGQVVTELITPKKVS